MPLVLTPEEEALLKSKLLIGGNGFRGEVEIDHLAGASAGDELQDLAFAAGVANARVALESGSVTWAHATIEGWFGSPLDSQVDEIPVMDPALILDNDDASRSVRPSVALRGDGVVADLWEVDLGSGSYEIVGFRVLADEGVEPTSIDYSDDGVTWFSAVLGTWISLGGWIRYVDLVTPASHRFWRCRYARTVVGTIFGLSFYGGRSLYTFGIIGFGATEARRVTVVYRVASMQWDFSRKMAAAQLNALFDNEDGSKGWYTAAAGDSGS